ncbi:MAG TPA: bifunctional serine/threonine-protein kinase/formylglycine-generating enzyme family protein [Solimonas sp.]|nr:bifunctional serine/threonine-protein kinase/formylglycine-generating enzyme family protein [Solimonas sp.]
MGPKTEFIGFLPLGTELFEYRIEQVLGHGGFGITYLARDGNLDKIVAIKEYLPGELALRVTGAEVRARSSQTEEAFVWGREQFLNEARTLALFDHPNLISVYRFFEANGTAYYVMDFIEGATLGKRLKRDGPLDEAALRGLLVPLLDGLEQVHRAGVLHRDVKPDNIMLRADGAPVLIDFGAARLNLGEMTHSVLSVLTAGYAPLEQYGSTANQGPWTDLYALGAVTYRMLSGKRPTDAVSRVHEDPLVPASMIGRGRYSEPFLRAVDWALSVKPEDRPRSVGEWREALMQAPAVVLAVADDPELDPDTAEPDSTEADSRPAEGPEISATVLVDRDGAGSADDPGGATAVLPPERRIGAGVLWLAALALISLAFLFSSLHERYRKAPAAPARAASAPAELAPAPPPVVTPPDQSEPAIAAAAGAAPEPAIAPAESAAVDAPPTSAAPGLPEPQPAPAAAAPARRPSRAPRVAPVAKPAAQRVPVTQMTPGSQFQDCAQCPVMVVLPPGRFRMGAAPETVANAWEQPAHDVRLATARAIGRLEVSNAQWRACVAGGGCKAVAAAGDSLPVVGVNWSEAAGYAAWLARSTQRSYRLPSEAEWEYAVRGGTTSARYWGERREQQCSYANGADASAALVDPGLKIAPCDDRHARLAPAGVLKANAFGLHDMAGNAWEWMGDCWRDSYAGAPQDGSAVAAANCRRHVIRGGSWRTRPESFRSAARGFSPAELRSDDLGLRVVAE